MTIVSEFFLPSGTESLLDERTVESDILRSPQDGQAFMPWNCSL
jgi:hypothetical protein